MTSPSLFVKTALWLLVSAAVLGMVLAFLRYTKRPRAATWTAKAHGFVNSAALALLVFAWATTGLPKLASVALVLLLLTAAAGLVTGQAWRWKNAHRVELILFAHVSLAVSAWFLLLASGGTTA
jgi:hypothetical protein